jgi:hypothetical protein
VALWTQYDEVAYREGQLREAYSTPKSAIAEGHIRAGLLCLRGTNPQQVFHPAAIPAADPNAIDTALASAAATQTLTTAAQLDGVVGIGVTSPAKRLTVEFDANANWDTPSGACRVEFWGEDANGEPTYDRIVKPNGSGAGIYTTAKHFSKVTRVDVEACNGAGGTAEIGHSAASVEFGTVDGVSVSLYDRAREPAAAVGYDFDTTETLSVLKKGLVAVTVETTIAVAVTPGDAVYARSVVAGADLRGQFTGVTSSADFGRVLGWKWRTTTAAGAVGLIELA